MRGWVSRFSRWLTDEQHSPKANRTLTTFRDLGVLPEICDPLERAGITTPFAIQEMTLQIALLGTDLIGQARTGTGKTLAFGIPVLQRSVAPKDPDYSELPQGKPQALIVAPTRELALQVSGDLALAGQDRGLRVLTIYGGVGYEPQLEALVQRRRRGRRHARPAARPGQPPRPRPLPRPRAGPRRGRRDARPRLPARRGQPDQQDAGDPADDAVLGDHARGDRLAGAGPHAPPDEHPRRVVLRERHRAGDRAVHLPGPRPRQARDHRPDPAGRGRGQDDRLHPHQAAVAADRRGPRRARLPGLPAPRRHGAGRTREGDGPVPRGQDPGPGLHRRRRPRHRRARGLPRRQLHLPRGRQDLHPPDRPHRPRRRLRHRDHLRRLGRPPPLEDDQQGAGPALRRAAGDVLHLRAPLPRPGDRARHQGPGRRPGSARPARGPARALLLRPAGAQPQPQPQPDPLRQAGRGRGRGRHRLGPSGDERDLRRGFGSGERSSSGGGRNRRRRRGGRPSGSASS